MGGLKKRVGELAQRLYRALPAGGRRGASAIIHGETDAQRRLVERVRTLRAGSLGIPGEGEQLGGSLLHPHRAEIATSFDAHAHLEDLRLRLAEVLSEGAVPVHELPGVRPCVLVVSDNDWSKAWTLLAGDPRTRSLWAAEGRRRAVPVSDRSDAPADAECVIFRRLVAPGGHVLADGSMHVRLERWSEVTQRGVRRVDGGEHEIGTLLRGELEPNGYSSELSPAVRATLVPGADAVRFPAIDAVTEPVDLVYTWVDGSDLAWLEKRARWEGTGFTADAQLASRFVNHDELRYSLRSVEMYANWFNHLYLVTDAQVPEWLNREHPRLTVVDHRDLFTEDELPLFNSHAIESRLHHIPGLSERFIYLNDDVFFGSPVWPEDFYTGAGQARFFPSRATIDPGPSRPDDVSVTSAAKNNRDLLERALGRTITTKLKHTPHAQLVSLLGELEERFPEVFEGNVRARFRSHTDHSVVSGLAQRYGAATGRAVVSRIPYNYADISRPDIEQVLARWLRSRQFAVFCLNDTGTALDDVKAKAFDDYLRRYFPVASGFEL